MSEPNDFEEAEANYFAICLLMPEEFVRMEVLKLGGKIDFNDDAQMLRLARKFQVPMTLMTLRIAELYKGAKLP